MKTTVLHGFLTWHLVPCKDLRDLETAFRSLDRFWEHLSNTLPFTDLATSVVQELQAYTDNLHRIGNGEAMTKGEDECEVIIPFPIPRHYGIRFLNTTPIHALCILNSNTSPLLSFKKRPGVFL